MNRLREIQSIGVKFKETQAPASGSTARVYRMDPQPVNGVDINGGNVPRWFFLYENYAKFNQWPFWVKALDTIVGDNLQDLTFEGQLPAVDEREFKKWVEKAYRIFVATQWRWDSSAVRDNMWDSTKYSTEDLEKLREERFESAKARWIMEKPAEKPLESFDLPVRMSKGPCGCS